MLEPGDYVEDTQNSKLGIGEIDYFLGDYVYVNFGGKNKKYREKDHSLKNVALRNCLQPLQKVKKLFIMISHI